MKAGKLAICRPWLSVPYKENTLVDLPFSVHTGYVILFVVTSTSLFTNICRYEKSNEVIISV